MVDVTLFVQAFDAAGAVPEPHVIETGVTYKVQNAGLVALMFRKSGAGTAIVTVVTPATGGGLPVADRTITVPANTGDVIAAKFPPTIYNGAGHLSFTTDDGLGLTCRVMALKGGAAPALWWQTLQPVISTPDWAAEFSAPNNGRYMAGDVARTFAQVVAATRASIGTRFDLDGILQTNAIDVARFDHLNGVPRGLLREEERENILRNTEGFEGASWVTGATGKASISGNVIASPDGAITADKLVEDSTSSVRHRLFSSGAFTLTVAKWAYGVFAKFSERKWIKLRLDKTALFNGCFFDLENGAVGTADSGYTGKIKNVGGGWFRCDVEFTGTVEEYFYGVHLATGDTVDTYDGDGVSGVFVWGATLELGEFSTSYIKTAGSDVTRNRDIISMVQDGADPFPGYDHATGTWVAHVRNLGNAVSPTINGRIVAGVGTEAPLQFTSNGQGFSSFSGSLGLTASDGATDTADGNLYKVALGYDATGRILGYDGRTPVTDSESPYLVQTPTLFSLGAQSVGTNPANMWIDALYWYPTKFTPDQIQAVTRR